MPVDAETISFIPTCDIAAIDVLKGPDASIFGSNGANGVIAVLTRTGNGLDAVIPRNSPGTLVETRMGYQAPKDYSQTIFRGDEYDTGLPDFRTTLYWNPNIKTDRNGKATFSFFTSDSSGPFTVDLQGISNNGKVGTALFEIKTTKSK
ncbi:MAG: TonB-dependent receptor plug domain-containing protein, partial [Leadbetterella sp.]